MSTSLRDKGADELLAFARDHAHDLDTKATRQKARNLAAKLMLLPGRRGVPHSERENLRRLRAGKAPSRRGKPPRAPWLQSLSAAEDRVYRKLLEMRDKETTSVADCRKEISDTWPKPSRTDHLPAECFACGSTKGYVRVHSHIQCKHCNFIVERCCGD